MRTFTPRTRSGTVRRRVSPLRTPSRARTTRTGKTARKRPGVRSVRPSSSTIRRKRRACTAGRASKTRTGGTGPTYRAKITRDGAAGSGSSTATGAVRPLSDSRATSRANTSSARPSANTSGPRRRSRARVTRTGRAARPRTTGGGGAGRKSAPSSGTAASACSVGDGGRPRPQPRRQPHRAGPGVPRDAHYPANLAALCPSCHRRAEFGGAGADEIRAAIA